MISSAVVIASCAGTGEPSTYADVCQKENYTLVSMEGYLILPNFVNPATGQKNGTINYQIYLSLQPDGKGQSVLTSVAGTKSSEPNKIADLSPMGYTYKDFRIFTDHGSTVGAADKVKITGMLVKTANSCQIAINRIEVP